MEGTFSFFKKKMFYGLFDSGSIRLLLNAGGRKKNLAKENRTLQATALMPKWMKRAIVLRHKYAFQLIQEANTARAV